MTAPLQTLLQTSLIFALVALASARADAQPAPLPENPNDLLAALASTEDVVDGLNSGSSSASRCRVEQGVPTCECLRDARNAYQLWSPNGVEGLAASQGETEFFSAKSAIAIDGIWVLRDVDFLFADAVLHVDELHLEPSGTSMAGLTWHEGGEPVPIACGAKPHRGRTTARADRADFADGRWRISGYRVGPWPVTLAKSAHRAAPGLLPPRARASNDAVEFEGSVLVVGGLFASAAAGINAPLSIGGGWISERRESTKVLQVMASVDDNEVGPVAIGDIAIGRSTHLRGHVEHPSVAEGWVVRRAEAGGFFRDWRVSHMGAAASGDAHALQISGSVLTDPAVPDPQWAGLVTYGTSFDGGRFARWTLDIEHDSERGGTTRHSTTTGLGLRVPLGWAERAWLSPGADLLANYGAVSVARGFDASTTLSALGSIETGLAFEGRAMSVRHRVAPVVRVGGELGGVQQRQAREGAPDYLYTRPDRWRWGVAVLEQSLRLGAIAFEAPIGVFADAIGDESITDGIRGFGGFARTSAVMEHARVDAAAACVDSCERVGLMASAQVSPHRGLTISYSASDLADSDAALVFADRLTERAFTSIRMIADTTAPIGFAQVAAIRARRGQGFAALEGRLGSAASSRGVGAEVGWRWDPLGWGLGVSGAWLPATDDWGLSAGLSFAR